MQIYEIYENAINSWWFGLIWFATFFFGSYWEYVSDDGKESLFATSLCGWGTASSRGKPLLIPREFLVIQGTFRLWMWIKLTAGFKKKNICRTHVFRNSRESAQEWHLPGLSSCHRFCWAHRNFLENSRNSILNGNTDNNSNHYWMLQDILSAQTWHCLGKWCTKGTPSLGPLHQVRSQEWMKILSMAMF